MATQVKDQSAAAIRFAPRRLGHANLFVADLEAAIAWHRDVAGIELVRREPGINAGFHSNGNTHHDLGLIRITGGAVIGINGFQQPSSFRGGQPGLNHLGWEMNSERELVAALARGKTVGLRVVNYANHQISHSAYVPDPDGNYHEFYADVVESWRSIFNLDREELVTERWDWEKSAPGMAEVPIDSKDRRRVDAALFHPCRITHSTLVAADFAGVDRFLTEVAGLSAIGRGDGIARYRARRSERDLDLVDAKHGWPKGLLAVSLLVEDEGDLKQSIKMAADRGVAIEAVIDRPEKLAALVKNPDGGLVEFYTPRGASARRLPSPTDRINGVPWVLAA
ncbi:MAG: hypothetical protein FJX52_06850 [Alphaproteobacteria bacterium]|nr:hypothetical protein [Alphaproteobacteria bacterium]